MKVKIVKCTNSRAWYLSRIGEEFDVDNKWHDDRFYRHISKGGWELVIRKSDCIEVDGEKSLDELLKPKLPKESQMKKLNIRKDYDDGKILISRYSHELVMIIIRSKVHSERHDLVIRMGEDYSTTLDQANAMLKIMGLDYELYESIEWSKVEVGSKVKLVKEYENGIVSWFTATFKEYIEETNQIIVLNGNKVEVYDEDRVELV